MTMAVELYELMQAVGRLEGKIDGVLLEQRRSLENQNTLERRVGLLEQKVSGLVGWAAGAGAAAAAVVTIAQMLL